MANRPREFTYTIETLAQLSDWPVSKVYQDMHRGDALDTLEGVAVWLAKNGNPATRAKMVIALAEDLLGFSQRTSNDQKALGHQLIEQILTAATKARKSRGKSISRTKQAEK